jgi:hypothetical protein
MDSCEPHRRAATVAERKHKNRVRTKRGIKMLSLPTRYDAMTDALIEAGWLTEARRESERSVRAALARFLRAWINKWMWR